MGYAIAKMNRLQGRSNFTVRDWRIELEDVGADNPHEASLSDAVSDLTGG